MNKQQPSQDDCQGSPSYCRNRIYFSGNPRFIAVFIAAPFSQPASSSPGHSTPASCGTAAQVPVPNQAMSYSSLPQKKKKSKAGYFFVQDKQVF